MMPESSNMTWQNIDGMGLKKVADSP